MNEYAPSMPEPEVDEPPARGPRIALGVAAFLVAMVALALFVVGRTTTIGGTSMSPSYPSGTRVWATNFGSAERGQVVLVKIPESVAAQLGQQVVMRRIIAVGGDHLSVIAGKFAIDGKILDEPYLEQGTTTIMKDEVVVPKGKVFVAGDRRSISLDSRAYGALPVDDIVSYVRVSL